MTKYLPSTSASRWPFWATFLMTSIFCHSLFAQDCTAVELNGNNGQIKITGLTAPIEIIDVYDANWQRIFRCQGGDCGNEQTIPNLSAGLYHTNIQLYTASWQAICTRSEDVTVSDGGSTGGLPDLSLSNIQNFPSTAQKGSVATFNFDLNNFGQSTANGAYKINIYLTENRGVSQFDPVVGEINTGNTPVGTTANVTAAVTIPLNQNEGDYYLILRVDDEFDIEESNESNNFLVSAQTFLVTGGTGGQTVQCGDIRIDYSPGTIAMKGLANTAYFFKIHDLNAGWAEVYSCGYNCGSTQTATGLGNGDYMVRVYNSSWGLICEQAINLVGGGSGCGNEGDDDGDGVCNNTDNCRNSFNPDQIDSDGNGVGDACDVATGACSFQTEYSYNSDFFYPSLSRIPSNVGYSFYLRDRSNGAERINLDLDGNITNVDIIPPSTGTCQGVNFCFDTEDFPTEKRIEVTRKGNNGTIAWVKSYTINHPTNILGIPFSPSVHIVGGHLVLQADFIADDGWFTVLFKLNRDNGNAIWQNQFKHTRQPRVGLFSEARNGGYYFTNSHFNDGIDIIKIDANGNRLWEVPTTGDLVSNDVFILGETPDATGFYYAMRRSDMPIAVRLNSANGQKIWEKRLSDIFSPNRGLFGYIAGAVITSDGGIVAGYSWRDPGAPVGEVSEGYEYGKLDANGNLVWWHDLPSSIIDSYANPIASYETEDGGYIFTAFDRNANKLFLLKITNQGTLTPECGGNTGGGNTIQCGEITINYTSNSIAMNGQSGKNYNYKIHDLNNGWAEAFSCTYQCGNSQTANNLANGRYLVKVFDESWSLVCEQEITLGASSRNSPTNLESFTVYPNPAQEVLYINLKEFIGARGEVAISNIYGQIVHQQTVESVSDDALRISLADFVNGFYFVNIKIPNRQLRSEKILVKRLY